jgi:hypothetical protein
MIVKLRSGGEKIMPPGLLLPLKEHAEFMTEDCIRAPKL